MRFTLLTVGCLVFGVTGASPANAATVIKTTGMSPYKSSTGPGGIINGVPTTTVPKDRVGTLFISGLGSGISMSPGRYTEDVQLQGTGEFADWNGLGQFSARREGQKPFMTVNAIIGNLAFYFEFNNPHRGAFTYNYDQVFTEKHSITSTFMNGDPFDYAQWSVKNLNDGSYYEDSSDDPAGGNTYNMVSNDLVTAPVTVMPPVSSALPEPATWAMMIVGFGLIGAAARRRRRRQTGAVLFT